MPNVEIKCRYKDLDRGARFAKELGARSEGVLVQRDTYFKVASGRLKLREIQYEDGSREAQLIPYLRPTQSEAKVSEYQAISVPNPEESLRLFSQILGVDVVVEKERALFLWDNVRIHLDRVKGLGNFLEFEAVYHDSGQDSDLVKTEKRKIDQLLEQFCVSPSDWVESSYRELLKTDRNHRDRN